MHLNLLTLYFSPLALALTITHPQANHPKPIMSMNMKPNPILRPTNQTLGHATVYNKCPLPVYLWSVGSTISPQVTLLPNATYTELYRRDPQSGGIALKLTRVPNGLYVAAPQMVFAYNLVGGQVWYDLSDVFGDPFEGSRVRVEYRPVTPVAGNEGEDDDDEGEEGIEWVDGMPPGGSMVRVADGEGDLVLTIC